MANSKQKSKAPVDWCIGMLEVSLQNYDVEAMRNYLVALKLWRNRELEANGAKEVSGRNY